jgi:Putative Actinobacterial Holin-X, holin superfamily III
MYSGRYRSDMESPEPNLGGLVSGILNDVKELVTDGVALAKLEVRDELRKAKVAAVAAGVGIGVMAVGGLLLLVMFVHLLAAFTVIPLWGCYGIVGGALLLIGAVLLMTGKRTVT